MKNLMFIFAFLFSVSVFAESARIELFKGSATFQGKPITKDTLLEGEGEIITGAGTYLKLILKSSETRIVFGSGTTAKINFAQPSEKQELNLVTGIMRWVTGMKKGKGIKTPNTVLGVRGTDFFASYNPLLGETEIICFEGSVQLTNAASSKDTKLVSKNQWGGIGGRFGKKLSNVLTLSAEMMSIMNVTLPR